MNKNETAKGNEDLIKALHKEAEEIEKRAEPYREQRLSQEEKDDMYLKIMERLREMGELDKEDEDAPEVLEEKAAGTDGPTVTPIPSKTVKKPLWKKITKCACIIVAAGAAVFATSLISEGNRMYWMEKWHNLFPGSNTVTANNDDDRILSYSGEQEAKEEIEKQLSVPMPEFLYLPDDMEFVGCSIVIEQNYAKLDYQYHDNMLFLSVTGNEEDISESLAPQITEEDIIHIDVGQKKEISIILVEDSSGSNNTIYRGQWLYDNWRYELSGVIEKEEIIKILKKIRYNV